jgi:hypothetical protein
MSRVTRRESLRPSAHNGRRAHVEPPQKKPAPHPHILHLNPRVLLPTDRERVLVESSAKATSIPENRCATSGSFPRHSRGPQSRSTHAYNSLDKPRKQLLLNGKQQASGGFTYPAPISPQKYLTQCLAQAPLLTSASTKRSRLSDQRAQICPIYPQTLTQSNTSSRVPLSPRPWAVLISPTNSSPSGPVQQ